MFSQIFNDKNNIYVLEEFIASYFDYDLKDVRGHLSIQQRTLFKNIKGESSKEVDLLLDYHGDYINIEMSTSFGQNILDRNIVFLSNIHSRQLKEGFNSYKDIKKTVQINFITGSYRKKLVSELYLTDIEDNFIATKKFKIDLINMETGMKMWYDKNTYDERTTKIIKWCNIFMSTQKDELENILNETVTNKSKEILINNISRLSGNEEIMEGYINMTKHEWEHEAMMAELNEMLDNAKNDCAKLKEESEKMKETAKEESEKMKETAKEESEKMKETAKEESEKMKETAKEESEKMKELAKQEAEMILKKAQQEAENIIAKEQQKIIALNLLKKNMDIEEIVEVTGLTKEEIENLKK